MPSGPRPLPKNVRMLRGGKPPKTAAPDNPDPPVKIPQPPDDLTPEETDVFVVMAKKLAGMRVMTEADVEALAIYCRNWVVAKDAHMRVGANILVKSPNGHAIQNPYFAIARKAEDRCLKILAEFGMTPAARVRVSKAD